MKITENCIINGMPDKIYHADPTPELEGFVDQSSLSSTTLNNIMQMTEMETRLTINRLNPTKDSKSSAVMDLGTIAHDYVLSGGNGLYEIAPFDSWRTKDSKDVKANIEGRGLIALNLSTQGIIDDVKLMKSRLLEQINEHKDWKGIFDKGMPEQAAFMFDGEVWNRALLDWHVEDYTSPHGEEIEQLIVDYKTTGLDFEKWEKQELWNGKYFQEIHYRRILDKIKGVKSRFIFCVQQTKAPFLVQIFEIDESFLDEIEKRYDLARSKITNCLKTGIWKGCMPYTAHSFPPPWIITKWETDQLNHEFMLEKQKSENQQPTQPQVDVSEAG